MRKPMKPRDFYLALCALGLLVPNAPFLVVLIGFLAAVKNGFNQVIAGLEAVASSASGVDPKHHDMRGRGDS
jgi:hypothetical protein